MEGLGSTPRAVATTLRPWATTLCRDLMRTLVTPLDKAMTDQMRQFEQQRASIKQPIDPTNPDFLRLNAQVNEANQYLVNKLRKTMRFQLDDFPVCRVYTRRDSLHRLARGSTACSASAAVERERRQTSRARAQSLYPR
jgi:hypothetical protein